MKFYTKITHILVYSLRLEDIFLKLSTSVRFFRAFIPQPANYKPDESRTIVRNEVSFKLYPEDYMQWSVFAGLEQFRWKAFDDFLINNSCWIDVGANCGEFCLQAAKRALDRGYHNFSVYAFEPNPKVFDLLNTNLSLNQRLKSIVHPVRQGLGNKKGKMPFVFNSANSGGGKILLKNTEDSDQLVSVDTLDHFVKKHGIQHIALIKIDVEGFEPLVIDGARNTINSFRPALYIEVSPKWWKENGYDHLDVFQKLSTMNYRLYQNSENKLEEVNITDSRLVNIEHQADILAIPT